MEHARIIRLGDTVGTSNTPRVATFEEAFGEYSELFGKKARARREKRRDDRTARKVKKQERKTERKLARQKRKDDVRQAKQERRSNRKQRRQQMRIDRRRQRKATRQAMRAEQQAARMARRMERKRQKQDRKDLMADRDMERELRMAEGQEQLEAYGVDEGALDGGYDDGGYDDGGYDDGGYDDGGYDDGGYDDGGYDDGGYDDGGYDAYDPYGDDEGYNPYADTGSQGGGGSYGGGGGYDDYGYEDDYGYDDGGFSWEDADAEYGYGGGGGYDDYEDYGSGDYNYEDDYGWGEEDFGDDFGGWNFDGEAGLVEGDTEQDEAQKIANKIEWNKKLISTMSNSGKGTKAINDRSDRITALKCQMRDYVCFDGDYFDEYEEEEFVGADGKVRRKAMKGSILRRMKKARRAKGLARRKAGFAPKRMAKIGARRGMAKRPTMVKSGIGAEIQNNRIVIPASSGADGTVVSLEDDFYDNATGTGVTALDQNADYGYEPTEIMLGADGSKSGMSKAALAGIGVVVGIGAIMLLSKTKVL
jgi:hypothetical protein